MAGGFGPVFSSEWRAASRRWQGYALRSLLVLLLLLGLSAVWLGDPGATGEASPRRLAEVGRGFYAATTLILLGLVGLAAPAATAGAICEDKARGNLLLLLATDLTDVEVVLGKLAARLGPVLALIGCAAPVLGLATLLGGVDPAMPFGSVLVSSACAVFGCSLALTLSVWGRRAHEVLLATYGFGILWLLAAPTWAGLVAALPTWARPYWLPSFRSLLPWNPVFLVLAPLGSPPGMAPVGLGAQARFGVLGLLASAGLVATAAWRVRAVVVRQAGRPSCPAPLLRLVPPPPLDANPVLWREWHRRRPSRWSFAVRVFFVMLSVGFALWAVTAALDRSRRGDREVAAVLSGVQVAAGLLLLGVSAATSLAEERRLGSLDVLLATPLSTRSIVLGKWRGALRGVWPLTASPMLIAAALSTHTGPTLLPILIGGLVVAHGAATASLGLAVATWLPRMSWAVGVIVGACVIVAIAPVPAGMVFLGDGPDGSGPGFASASPLWGVGFSSGLCGGTAGPVLSTSRQAAWLAAWVVAYGAVAAGLLLATLGTFNRCFGRNDGTSKARPARGPVGLGRAGVPTS